MTALLLGPFQFFPRIRKTYPHTHRLMGKIYLVSILLAEVSSIFLSVIDRIIKDTDVVFGTGAIGLALAWLVSVLRPPRSSPTFMMPGCFIAGQK